MANAVVKLQQGLGADDFESDAKLKELKLLIGDIRENAQREKYIQLLERGTFQEKIGFYYDHQITQNVVNILILLSCLLIIIDAESAENEDWRIPAREQIQLFFTISFTIDVLWNIVGHIGGSFFFGHFAFWNVFVLAIVGTNLIFTWLHLPNQTLMSIRTFRILKLFGRNRQFKKTLSTITASIYACGPILCIAILFISIFGLLGHNLFQNTVKYEEHWGTFSKSFYTLFQCMTFESWSSGVARLTVFDGGNTYPVILGMMLYWFIFESFLGIFMINVTMAAFFEAYGSMDKKLEDEEIREDISLLTRRVRGLDGSGDGTKSIHRMLRETVDQEEANLSEDAKTRRKRVIDTLCLNADRYDTGMINRDALHYAYLRMSQPGNSGTSQMLYQISYESQLIMSEMREEFLVLNERFNSFVENHNRSMIPPDGSLSPVKKIQSYQDSMSAMLLRGRKKDDSEDSVDS